MDERPLAPRRAVALRRAARRDIGGWWRRSMRCSMPAARNVRQIARLSARFGLPADAFMTQG